MQEPTNMPLLETSSDGKSWPSSLTTLGPEQVAQGLDNVVPHPQLAYCITPTIQPVMSLGTAASQTMSATIVSPGSGGGHEIRPIANPLSYTSSVVSDPPLPTGIPRADPAFTNIQQPSILNHPAIMQIPGARSPARPMVLQGVPIYSNIGHMVEGSGLQTQLVGGFGAYAGPVTFGTAQPSNGFPVTISGNEIQHMQNSQSAASPHCFTAVGSGVSNYPGPIQPNSATISNLNADYPEAFTLQPSLKNITPRQESIGFNSGQSVAEAEDTDTQLTQDHVSLKTTNPIPDHGYARAHAWKDATEDGLSDLNKMAQAWLRSNITSFDDVLQHIPLEELGKQALIIREPGLLPQGKTCSWNLVKIENVSLDQIVNM